MHVTINQLGSGLIPQPSKKQIASFELDALPESLRARAQMLLSPDTIGKHTNEPVSVGGADRVQLEIEFTEKNRVKSIRIDEAACSADFLELLDQLSSGAP